MTTANEFFDSKHNQELINKLFNTKPNEELIKLLKDEIVINPENAQNIIKLFESLKGEDSQMNNEIIIDDKELVEYIVSKSSLSKEDITKVLDLEFEFLKLKGVVE